MTGIPSSLRSPLNILGTAIGMCGGFAVVFGGTFGLFVKPIAADLDWSRSQTSLLMTAAFLGYSLGAPILGQLYDRFNARLILIPAIGVFSLALVGLGLAPGNLLLMVTLAFFVGIGGAATAPSGYVLLLAKRFELQLGAVIGLAMLGLGIGVSLSPVVAQFLISGLGWRQAYIALGVIALCLGAVALLLGVGARPPRVSTTGDGAIPADGDSLRQALGSWRFWLLSITSVVIGSCGFGTMAHLAAVLSDRGLSPETAAQALGLSGAGIFIGRIATAFLMDRIFAPLVALGCCLLGAAGLLILALVPSAQPFALFGGALMAGLLLGSEGDTMPFLTRRYFGGRAFGAIFGWVIGLAALGGIFGPLAFGTAFDLTGGYGAILIGSAALCALSGVALAFMGPYRFAPPVHSSEKRKVG